MRDRILKFTEHRLPIKRPDGNYYYLRTEKIPLYGDGKVTSVLAMAVDITDQTQLEAELIKQKEIAEQADLVKNEFICNMQHDIRTPLAGIIGCAQLIQLAANNPEKVLEYAEDLIESSSALLEFLNRVLDAIKVASGASKYARKIV